MSKGRYLISYLDLISWRDGFEGLHLKKSEVCGITVSNDSRFFGEKSRSFILQLERMKLHGS